ncbi:MAG: putative glycoside hydrolase [Patescibacteria group bacterium]|nr:polysaccharide deacetylase family protein [Patescibacteria group bacterium]
MKRFILIIGLVLLLVPSLADASRFTDEPHVPVLEYHSVGETEARWTRSYENFKKDLEWLYNNDYVLVSVQDFVHMDFDIPAGKKPVIFTFDDGNENQFRYLENGDIDSNSAIGIMDAFYEKHPEFGRAATFYVNSLPFGKEDEVQKKLWYLISTGREIGNHTLTHASLNQLGTEGVKTELGGLVRKISEYVGTSILIESIAYPHGLLPEDVSAVASGEYQGYFYENKVGFLVGAEPSRLPGHESFDPMRVPRIQAIDDEWRRWFGRANADVTEKTEGNFRPYIFGEKKRFPYHECGDPDAERFILKKQLSFSFSSWRNFFLSLLGKEKEVEPRAIYLNTGSLNNEAGFSLVEKLVENGGNAVVLDILPAGKLLPYPGETYVDEEYEKRVREFINYMKEKNLYVIARYVLFKNPTMSAKKPEWLLESKATGKIWSGDGGPVWLDPSISEVQDYIIEATKKVIELGVDEVQYDYVRFPTAPNSKDVSYHAMRAAGEILPTKWTVIRDFLKRVRQEVDLYDVKLGVDLYAIVAWNDGFDAYSTGQKIECLAPYVDVIYPMVYPSHFGPGFGGHANPADEPYYFVKKTSELFLGYMEGTEAKLRPWLQAFAMRVTDYNSQYVPQQSKALEDLGIYEYALWNASNVYDLHWKSFNR